MLKICLIIGLSACLVVGIPSPQVEEDEYEDDKVCLTSVDSKDPETECILPFTHDNITYYGCPTDPEDATRRWCSTKTDKNGVHIPNENAWGYCTPGCKPEIDIDANKDVQTDTCDFSACNGFSLKADVYDKTVTFGQCQYPAGENGSKDDYFCFVNANSACDDKVPYGDEEGLFVTSMACKDPKAPLPKFFGFGFSLGFRSSRGGRSRGRSSSASFSAGFCFFWCG